MDKSLGRIATLMAAGLVATTVGGCAIKHPTANLVTGTVAPNLDDAFRQDRIDGVKSTSIQGLISFWIQYPNSEGVMPAMLVKGQDAQDVAAYIAAVAAKPGADTGALAAAGGVTGTTPAAGKQVFTGVGGCGSCHVLADAGTKGVVGPNLDKD